ncbi:MAG: glycosyltransferase, partial [Planctomycetota bacterium]|nr:glycosyltransferase [Planctomycetota bacterium]
MARIAFLIDDLKVGGSELFLRDLVIALEKDQDVRVITLFASGPVGEELIRSGITVLSLGLRKWNAPWKFLELISLLNDQSIQILHCERTSSSIVGVLAGRLASIQSIFMRRGSLPWWPGLVTRWLDGLAMGWCDIVMTASEAIRDDYIKEQGLGSEKFEVIPHGLAGPFAPPRSVEEKEDGDREGPIIGCVANFNWRKDHPTLLQAFRAVCKKIPTAKLQLVGAGPLEIELREEVERSEVRDKVEFLGSRSDAREVMRQFDVLVLPSRTEGFGRVLLEGMAAGVPIVSTSVGGIPEVISNDLTGILVRPGSSEAMAGAILHVLTEPAESRRLVTNARNDLRDRFSLESVVTRYRQIVGIDPSPEPSTPKGEVQTEQVPCPLCRGSGETPITIRPDGHRVVRCSDCGLIYLNPMPTKEALAAMYTLEYFEG